MASVPGLNDESHSMKELMQSIGLRLPSEGANVAAPYAEGAVHRTRKGNVRLTRLISNGTYGKVWEVRRNSHRLALKVQSTRNVTEKYLATRELRALHKVSGSNEHVVRLLDYWWTQDAIHMVFELLGPSLHQICRVAEERARMNYDVITHHLVGGLSALHKAGVLHRDIKPTNICLSLRTGFKFVDLGMASIDRTPRDPKTPERTTLWYRAPEMLLGATNYHEAVDLWSLGCTLSEAFFGCPLFPEQTEIGMMDSICGAFGVPIVLDVEDLSNMRHVRPLADNPRNLLVIRTRNRLLRLQPFMREETSGLLRNFGCPHVAVPSDIYHPSWKGTDLATLQHE